MLKNNILIREHPFRSIDSGPGIQATRMQIAFEKLLALWFLFSRRKSVFVCSRSFYLLLNEKVFLLQYKCYIKTRFLRCSSHKFAGFTVIVWLREISEFFSLCDSHQAQITQVKRSFSYMWEIPLTLVFTCLFCRYFKIVWPQVCFLLLSTCKVSQKNRCKCHRSIIEKETVTNAKSLFVGA